MKINTSFEDLRSDEKSWLRGRHLQTILGVNRPAREDGTNIIKAKYGLANLHWEKHVIKSMWNPDSDTRWQREKETSFIKKKKKNKVSQGTSTT